MSISGITSGFSGSGPMGAGPLMFSGNINQGAAVTAATGGGNAGDQPMSALGKAARDMAAFLIIDSYLEAKGVHMNKNQEGIGIAAAALSTYAVSPGQNGMAIINKISQATLALSTFQAIA